MYIPPFCTSEYCNWMGLGDHLCHRCHKKPGQRRFYYDGHLFSLAGSQTKFSVKETWGCDDCWVEFQKILAAKKEKHDTKLSRQTDRE